MGDVPENEQNWDKLARAKGFKCTVCNNPIPFGEREVYFETKLCGFCHHSATKVD